MRYRHRLKALWLLLTSDVYVVLTDRHFTYAVPRLVETVEDVQDIINKFDLDLEELHTDLVLEARD